MRVDAKDYASAPAAFFGDRPLDNPGYSKMELTGEVKVGSTNRLDVLKVEQRLKYLGFPAMGSDAGGVPTAANNTIQDFKVDGVWGRDESLAGYLFGSVVNYGPNGHRQLANPTVTKETTVKGNVVSKSVPRGAAAVPKTPATNRAAYFDDLYSIANNFTVSSSGTYSYKNSLNNPNSGSGAFLTYLNAYNAPHWMNVYQSIQAAAGLTVTSGMSPQGQEQYGVSWMRDLMVASQYADPGLRPGSIHFNGVVDANHGATPFAHGSHDLGMAFDLGVSNVIDRDIAQIDATDAVTPSVAAALVKVPSSGTWDITNAVDYSSRLPSSTSPNDLNNQVSAIRSFLSLYAVTQSSSWATMSTHVVNGASARDALFGSGVQDAKQLISKVIIGGTRTQNSYPNMRKVLGALGVGLDPQVINHNSHFHVYLNPPKAKDIGPAHLLTNNPSLATPDSMIPSAMLESESQNLLSYVETLTTEGDELMFTLDLPCVPVLEAPIVLAQAATKPGVLKPDYQLTICKETESTGDPKSAMRAVDPAGMLAIYLQNRNHRVIDLAARATIKPIILEAPVHGKLTSGVSDGRVFYGYDAEPSYVGKDKAVFMAEFEGKRYKIVVNLVVSLTVFESPLPDENPVCPPWKLIKVNGKSVSDASSYRLNSFTVTMGDLGGGAVGQTRGTAISLDTTAVGHGWYIDPTPLDNSDDYLPTSNPNIWQAKPSQGRHRCCGPDGHAERAAARIRPRSAPGCSQ